MKNTFEAIFGEVAQEIVRATEIYGPFVNAHHGHGVMREELEELWDEVKVNNKERMRAEAIQTAAMAIRFIYDLPDFKRS